MSLSLETEYVAPDNLPLEKCRYCDRRFFKESLTKHEHACERTWMRGNCKKERKPAEKSTPAIKEHITGYNVNIKTFAEMLALGAERRMRWRLRHQEFVHTVKSAKANSIRENGGTPEEVAPLSAEITQAGLTQCEFCSRRFNDAAFLKHREQCKEKSELTQREQTEEQKEARSRYLKRMRYSLKFINTNSEALQDEEQESDSAQEMSGTDTCKDESSEGAETLKLETTKLIKEPSSLAASSTPLSNKQEQELLQKFATELCLGAMGGGSGGTPSIPPELLQSEIFNKLIQQNLSSVMPFTSLQISNCNKSGGSESLMANSCASLISNGRDGGGTGRGGRGGKRGGGGVDSESINLSSPSAISSLSSLSTLLASSGLPAGLCSLESTSTAATAATVLKDTKNQCKNKSHHRSTKAAADGTSDLNIEPRLLTEGAEGEKDKTKSSHRLCKPPPTVVNNFMTEVDSTPNKKKSRSSKRPEEQVPVASSSAEETEERHKGCRSSRRQKSTLDGDHNDSPVVFYKFQEDESAVVTATEIDRKGHEKKTHHQLTSSRHKDSSEKPDFKSSSRCLREASNLRLTDTNCIHKHSTKPDSADKTNADVTESIVSKCIRKSAHHKGSSHHGHSHHKNQPSQQKCSDNPHRGSLGGVIASAAAAAAAALPVAPASSASTSASSRFCRQCGEKFAREARFCASCGSVRPHPDNAAPAAPNPHRHSILISSKDSQ